MYIECIYFKRGAFLKKEAPFFTKKGYAVYDKAVAKFSALPDQEVLIALRNDNHSLVKFWYSANTEHAIPKLQECRCGKSLAKRGAKPCWWCPFKPKPKKKIRYRN